MTTGRALIGRTLGGRFRVTGFIGEGAMACVYRGVQEAEPRDVAIKVMHPHLTTDRTFVGRFRREAKAAAQIRHPNSVRILDTGVDDKLLYIAMELLAGQDLFEVLSIERRLSETRAAKILIQVCDALAVAHEHGIVHRDLKPENVMILRDESRPDDDHVKVLDFGIAKILDPEIPESDGAPLSGNSMTALTNVGMVVGTPAYMSPEQCRGETIDARSDVYACGILLYQLVTGRLPFSGTNAMDYAVMHVRTTPTPPHEIVAGIHVELEALLLKALGKWPTMRHQSAKEFGAELDRIMPELATESFRDKPISVGALPLTSSETNLRHQTPEPVTRRQAETPEDDVFRTLPSERRMLESLVEVGAAAGPSRASRADTLEAPAFSSKPRAPSPSTDDATAGLGSSKVTITLRPEAPAESRPRARVTTDPPPSSFQVFDRQEPTGSADADGDATRRDRLPKAAKNAELGAARPPEEAAPTPLSRPIEPPPSQPGAVAEPARVPKVSEEPSTPPRAAPRLELAGAIAASQALAKPTPAEIARSKEARAWLVVPIALVIGLALGTLIFFVMR